MDIRQNKEGEIFETEGELKSAGSDFVIERRSKDTKQSDRTGISGYSCRIGVSGYQLPIRTGIATVNEPEFSATAASMSPFEEVSERKSERSVNRV